MRPLLLSTSDLNGGAARAAFRLHQGFRQGSIDSQMLVQEKLSDDSTIIGPMTLWEKACGKLRPQVDHLPLKLSRHRLSNPFHLQWLPSSVWRYVSASGADICHLHWICGGFISVECLATLGVPLIWTLHDSWPFTGGCHISFECDRYEQSCGRCPQLGARSEHDFSRWVWKRKKRSWMNLGITIVAPSQWMARRAGRSTLFKDSRIEVIPNGLDLDKFKPHDRQMARDVLGLPKDKKLILFGAMAATGDTWKGFSCLQGAVKELRKDAHAAEAEMVVFGAGDSFSRQDLDLKVHSVGVLHDDISLSLLYSAADVFVAPSTVDNLPSTVMEALACGTPCVAFEIGGMSDLIVHEQCGYLARPFNVTDLAQGIAGILVDEQCRSVFSRNARDKVERDYSIQKVVVKHLELYDELLNK